MVLIGALILLLGFHDQRLELKLSGYEALVDHLLLLLYLCLNLSKLSLLVLLPEGQLIDGLVVVQKSRLILFAELLGGLLLRVLELGLHIFELNAQVHFLVAEVLNQFFDLSKIVIFARTLRFQLKFQRAEPISVLSEHHKSHLRLLEVSQSLKILLIILVLLGLDRFYLLPLLFNFCLDFADLLMKLKPVHLSSVVVANFCDESSSIDDLKIGRDACQVVFLRNLHALVIGSHEYNF